MMRMVLAGLGLMALVGCGVDGAPVRPSVNASVGVGKGGVHTRVGTGVRIGGVNVGVGVGL